MKVLILGAEQRSANLGVNVLGQGATEVVGRAFPGASVEVMAFAPVPENPGGLGGRACANSVRRFNRPLREFFHKYDLVLDACGGDSFTDQYGVKRFANIVFLQHTARSAGARVVMLPQTIGPFGHAATKMVAGRALRSLATVMVRDRTSAALAERVSGVRPGCFTDLVFALPQPQVEKTRQVIVNVSGLLWNNDRHGAAAVYRSRVRKLVEGLLGAGLQITILPHVLDNPSPDNDLEPVREIARMDPTIELYEPSGLNDARSVIGSAEIVVAARMHACLNAISMGVPAVPWAYSDKFGPLMTDLGLTRITQDLRSSADPVAPTLALISGRNEPDRVEELRRARSIADRKINELIKALQCVMNGSS